MNELQYLVEKAPRGPLIFLMSIGNCLLPPILVKLEAYCYEEHLDRAAFVMMFVLMGVALEAVLWTTVFHLVVTWGINEKPTVPECVSSVLTPAEEAHERGSAAMLANWRFKLRQACIDYENSRFYKNDSDKAFYTKVANIIGQPVKRN